MKDLLINLGKSLGRLLVIRAVSKTVLHGALVTEPLQVLVKKKSRFLGSPSGPIEIRCS